MALAVMSFPAGAQRRGRETMAGAHVWIPFPRLWRAGDDTREAGTCLLSGDRT